ncbi:MAG TPA: 30S ribosome-binding factor RbfA [Ktedonobacterales bacterium]|nr:30S ribosome-binding factor RbfA [Ktedonobacterales bacterium]
MSKNWRQDQLGEVIAHELSDLIRTRMKDPRIGFASITDVDLSADLRHAKVFVSVMGDTQEQHDTLDALNHANGFLRHELAQRLTVRHTPEIAFRLDESIAHGAHVLDLINQVSEGTAAGAGAGASRSRRANSAESIDD